MGICRQELETVIRSEEGSDMAKQNPKPTPRELVWKAEPTAFVYDDSEKVYIHTTKIVVGRCPHCQQKWTRPETDHTRVLGAGGTEERAWENAARHLGLLKW